MRHHSSIAVPGALNASIDSSATNIQVKDAVGWPSSFPHTAVLDPDTTLEEIVTVTAAVGTAWTVVRAQDGTAAIPHASGAVVKHMATARDYREPQEHIDASTLVHGVTSGNVVGTSQAQTLTNKVMSGVSNTLSNIAQASVTGLTTIATNLSAHLAATTNVHGVGSNSVVGTGTIQTLTNKTLTSPTVSSPTVSGAAVVSATVNFTNASMLSKQAESDSDLEGFTTSYAPGSPVVGTTFVVPPSGKVKITVSGYVKSTHDKHTCSLSYEVRTGGTIGAGSVILTPHVNHSITAGQAINTDAPSVATGSDVKVHNLTPGSTYNVRTMHQSSINAGGQVFHRRILTEPAW